MRTCLAPLIALLLAWVSSPAAADNWAQFRGPGGNGLSAENNLPAQWGVDKNIAWKVKLPGVAWSQPIVWGEKVFVTTAETDNQEKPRAGDFGPGGFGPGGFGPGGFGPGGPGPGDFGPGDGAPPERGPGPRRGGPPGRGAGQPGPERGPRGFRGFPPGGFGGGQPPDVVYRWKVLCLDGATGKVLWERTAHEGKPRIPKQAANTYASETPATDGERVIAYFGMTGVYCYDLSGKLLWSKDLGAYPMQMGQGTGSSPVLDAERVFVQCDNEKASFLVALDKKTGDEVWRVARDEKSNWSTPYLWENKQRTELVTAGGTKMRSYRPEDGKLLWEISASGNAYTTPVGDEELLYVEAAGGMMGGRGLLAAVRAGATGDISLKAGETAGAFVAWSEPVTTRRLASPLLYAGCLYSLDQQGGIIRCCDAKTGKQHYRQRLAEVKGFTASPWASDGKVFCLDQDGVTVVLEASPQLKVVATNKLDEMFWSSAAVVGERLLVRGVDHLYCIERPSSAREKR